MTYTKGQSVYVSSNDSRLPGWHGTIVSIGRTYITVERKNGSIMKFYKETLMCKNWGVYRLEESEQAYNARKEREKKLQIIHLSPILDSILTDEEIDSIYNRIKEKFNL